MSSPTQVDFKLQNFHSAAAYILQKYHMSCGHDNQIQGVLCTCVREHLKEDVESTTHLNYIM
jgi:hypothetical protein